MQDFLNCLMWCIPLGDPTDCNVGAEVGVNAEVGVGAEIGVGADICVGVVPTLVNELL